MSSAGQKIGIIGAGESGVGAALLALSVGDEPFVSDFGIIDEDFRAELIENKVPFEEEGHTFDILKDCDVIVKSPGVPGDVGILQQLRDAGATIISELEYAYRHKSRDAKLIAITGSNGKTTTTNLIHHLIADDESTTVKGGNLGVSFARLVATKSADIYVIEVSSFQLDDVIDLSPDIAVLLNITPDHLDRYAGDFDRYAEAKLRLIHAMGHGAHIVYNVDDDEIISRLRAADGLTYHPVGVSKLSFEDFDVDNPALRGPHNAFNASCAITVARTVGVDDEVIVRRLADFVNDPHRLQSVANREGIEWINDSKATNVASTYQALQAMSGPTVWIVGGVDKGNDYSQLESLVDQYVKAIITLCVDSSKIEKAFGQKAIPIHHADNMKQAVTMAQSIANSGDTVLLSPACASFDLFKNYKDRGDQFVAAVDSLCYEMDENVNL